MEMKLNQEVDRKFKFKNNDPKPVQSKQHNLSNPNFQK